MKEETEFKDKDIEDLKKNRQNWHIYNTILTTTGYTFFKNALEHVPELTCRTTNQISTKDRNYTEYILW